MQRTKLFLSLTVIALAIAMAGGATLAWFTDSAQTEPVDFQAGTLLIDAGTSMIYGVERETGHLYEIDVVSGEEILLFDGTTNDGDQNYPNALAYDRNNQRLYYSDSAGNLRFHEIGTNNEVPSGTLAGNPVAGATFGRGYYWYIPQNSSTLYRASFEADGTLKENETYIQTITDLDGIDITFASFGDVAMDIRGNRLYGSARVSGSAFRYFVINLAEKETEKFEVESVNNMLQLAFGADGQLFGHATDSKQWFSVNTDTGDRGDIIFTGANHYTDLASNWQNNWNPGDCDMARFYVRNTGTKTSHVRFQVSGTWIGDLDDDNVNIYLCGDDSESPTNENDDWVKIGDYFYYKGILDDENPQAEICLIVCLDGEGTDNDYQGMTFELTPEFDAIQTTNDAPRETWSLSWNSENGEWVE